MLTIQGLEAYNYGKSATAPKSDVHFKDVWWGAERDAEGEGGKWRMRKYRVLLANRVPAGIVFHHKRVGGVFFMTIEAKGPIGEKKDVWVDTPEYPADWRLAWVNDDGKVYERQGKSHKKAGDKGTDWVELTAKPKDASGGSTSLLDTIIKTAQDKSDQMVQANKDYAKTPQPGDGALPPLAPEESGLPWGWIGAGAGVLALATGAAFFIRQRRRSGGLSGLPRVYPGRPRKAGCGCGRK